MAVSSPYCLFGEQKHPEEAAKERGEEETNKQTHTHTHTHSERERERGGGREGGREKTDLIPHVGSTTASILTACVAAALLCPYAKPPVAWRLKPAMLLVTTTWLLQSRLPLRLPRSSSGRHAMVVYHTDVELTPKVRWYSAAGMARFALDHSSMLVSPACFSPRGALVRLDSGMCFFPPKESGLLKGSSSEAVVKSRCPSIFSDSLTRELLRTSWRLKEGK